MTVIARDDQQTPPDGPGSGTGETFEIKGASFPLTVLRLRTVRWKELGDQLTARLERNPGYFRGHPLVLDLLGVREELACSELPALVCLLRERGISPVGVCNAGQAHEEAASEVGLAVFGHTPFEPASRSRLRPGRSESEGREPEPRVVQPPPAPAGKMVTQPVRSGQRVYARNGDLVVVGAVNAGAEVLADGNIHVYGPLRGRALAGARGDAAARIFCQSLEAELVSIAGTYRVIEDVPAEVRGRAAQIYASGQSVVISPL